MRIFSSYSQEEYNAIAAEAKTRGMSLSAYQRYLTLLSLPQNDTTPTDIPKLIQKMYDAIYALPSGTQFIVSTLIPAEDWCALSASEKRSLGAHLSSFAASHPELISKATRKVAGTISHYQKL